MKGGGSPLTLAFSVIIIKGDSTPLACLPDATTVEINGVGAKGDEKQSFTFDYVWNQGSKQQDVFNEVSQLVQSALDGYNVCLFAYGQTGSGKTFTMQGEVAKEYRGIIPRSIEKVRYHFTSSMIEFMRGLTAPLSSQ